MQEQLDYYKRVARLANVGAWKVNLTEKKATWDDVFAFIFEAGENLGGYLDIFFQYYKEGEERNRLLGLWRGLILDGVAFAAQFTAITAKGNIRQVETSAIPIYINGKVALVEGTVRDITENFKLREENRLLHEITSNSFEFTPNPCAQISLDGYFIKANQSFCNLLGYRDGELLGTAYQEILHKGEIPFRELFINHLLSK